ncbi:hypothetical protein AB0J90_18345 [Micromonospora sp. NPDC049523]|uniref:hypothetical protein n=1 Tax=Micromonospora sp. NPDC049523 TaxID=3155921 RepID=UPI00342CDD59
MDAFQLAVVTSPGGDSIIRIPSNFDLSDFSRYDEECLKPGLLYADHVDLYSYRSTLAQSLTSEAAKLRLPMLAPSQFFSLLDDYSDAQLQALGVDLGKVPDLQRFRQAGYEIVRELGGPLEFWRQHEHQIRELNEAYFRELRKGYTSMQSGAIDHAVKLGLVEVHHWNSTPTVPPEPYTSLWNRATAELGKAVNELDRPIMIDPASLSMIGAEPKRSLERTDADIEREVSLVWHEKVAPIVAELDYETRRSRYLRDLLGAVTEGKDALLSAAGVVVAVSAATSGMSVYSCLA